jgi:hypothetical protein
VLLFREKESVCSEKVSESDKDSGSVNVDLLKTVDLIIKVKNLTKTELRRERSER